jgi:hypothetical protein
MYIGARYKRKVYSVPILKAHGGGEDIVPLNDQLYVPIALSRKKQTVLAKQRKETFQYLPGLEPQS